jgi:murein DD-endopeptidase MepM/ murein hydrolase activator NlpD
LDQYSNRIINALKQERDAVTSNRNDIANAMQTNAKIEADQAATNQKIAQQNLDTQLRDQQNLSKAALDNYSRQVEATQKLVGTVAGLSLTAAKKFREIEIEKLEQKDKAEAAEILVMGDNHPAVKALKALKYDVQAEEVRGKNEIAKAREAGADRLAADEALGRLNQLGYHAKTSLLTHVGNQWGAYLREALISDKVYTHRETGKQFTGIDANANQGLALELAAQELVQFEKINGIAGQHFKQDFLQSFRFKLKNAKDAKTVQDIVEADFQSLRSLFGNEGAHEILQNTGAEVDIDGKPVYNLAGIEAARLGPNGETWGEYWSKRSTAARKGLVDGRASAIQSDAKLRSANAEADYQRIRPGLLQQLAAAGPKDDLSILETAHKQLFDRNGGVVPKSFTDLQAQILKENKTESENKAALLADKIQKGIATRGEVMSIADPTIRANTIELFDKATKVRKFGENYDSTLKSIKKAAMRVMGDSLEGASSFEADRLKLVMQKDFASDYEEGLKKFNGDTAAALNYASDRLEEEVRLAKAGTDKNSRYHSTTGPNNSKVFTNIKAMRDQTEAQKTEAMSNLIATLGAVGISALDSPGILGSSIDMELLSEKSRNGEALVFNPQIRQAAKLLDITEVEAANTAIAAFNKNGANIPMITVGPNVQLVNNARPETRALFFGENANNTTVQRGTAEVYPQTLAHARNLRGSMRQFVTSNTGVGTGPHADFRVWDKQLRRYVDPTLFMDLLSVNGKPLTEQFRMTSPYGMRTHPVTGEYKMHHGIDFATPEGTRVDVNASFLEEVDDPTAGIMGIYEFERGGRQYELHGLHGQRR